MRYEETSILPVDRLVRGLKTARVSTVWQAVRDLRALGPDWVPLLRAKLHTPDWEAPPHGRADKSLGILLALLDEFDHAAFEAEIVRLQRRNVHPHHDRIVGLLAQRLADNPAARIGRAVPVHVAKELGDPTAIVKSVGRWSRRVGKDLDEVARIEIAGAQGQDDFSRYNALFSGIMLTWPDPGLPRSEQKEAQMQPEYMFYRAVGHHVGKAAKARKFEAREKAADGYATKVFRRAHPLYARKLARDDKLSD